MTFKKIIGEIHLWLGFASGLVVLILGITGCLYAFEEEIRAWVYSDKLEVYAPVDTNTYPLSQNLEAAQKGLGEQFPIQLIIAKNSPQSSLIFWHTQRSEEASGIWFWDEIKSNFSVYLNPYNSEILEIEDATFEFFHIILMLHWSLLLKDDIGQPIAGVATLIFIIMLITGLILWWPKNKKALKMNTWFRWKETTKWRRKNYDLHNIVGFYSMFFALVVALTGLVWAFEWFDTGVQWLANGGETIEKERAKITSTISNGNTSDPLDLAYHHLKVNHSQAEIYYINLPQDSLGTITSYVAYEDLTRNVSLQFDQYSGALLHTGGKWEDKTNGEKLRAYNYDIHTGAIGGLVGKTVAFFLGLFSASLPITGFIIWWNKRKGKKIVSGYDAEPKPTNNPRPVLKPSTIRKRAEQKDPVFQVKNITEQ
ncbi:MAG: PepSY-associated TM helix domain-containing protein [Bacteroidota bacterium]